MGRFLGLTGQRARITYNPVMSDHPSKGNCFRTVLIIFISFYRLDAIKYIVKQLLHISGNVFCGPKSLQFVLFKLVHSLFYRSVLQTLSVTKFLFHLIQPYRSPLFDLIEPLIRKFFSSLTSLLGSSLFVHTVTPTLIVGWPMFPWCWLVGQPFGGYLFPFSLVSSIVDIH